MTMFAEWMRIAGMIAAIWCVAAVLFVLAFRAFVNASRSRHFRFMNPGRTEHLPRRLMGDGPPANDGRLDREELRRIVQRYKERKRLEASREQQ